MTIRNKIIGEADAVLEAYNTPLEWKAIVACLTHHYGDQRDLKTLEYQLLSLTQGNLSTNDFYQAVYAHLTLILSKISCMEASNESIKLLTQTYREKALDTFVRGLRGDLPRLLGVREPKDLPHALYLCQKLDNQTDRNSLSGRNQRPPVVLPPRRNIMQQVPKFCTSSNTLLNIHRDINSPQMQQTSQHEPPNKIQRNYHIKTKPLDYLPQENVESYQCEEDSWTEEDYQYPEEQLEHQTNMATIDSEDEIVTSLSDIHFLE
ncbi:Retrovirus-related Gag polyprotein from transposon HMS-Beagle [Eumeta japonica]|uniref:Retrovirus-related Gag polyprotein from transposon HMS-Beagle n=1 Tax=Eumeta variegata TaxID=151549 RepID=A0A4C1SFR3_EUMVA|nr:Retrovirus-related Gag polyprotein from transposon HMS-Beagle [Eumeta japonica]